MKKHGLPGRAKSENSMAQTVWNGEWQKMQQSQCATSLNSEPLYTVGKCKIHHCWSKNSIYTASVEASHQYENTEDMLMAHNQCWGWVAQHAPHSLTVGDGEARQRVKVTAGGGPPSFKSQMNTQTALGGNRPAAFCPLLCPPITFSRPDKCSATHREAKKAGERGRDEGGRAGPSGSRGTDVGWLALGKGRELTNANYCAKLLAKYVSPHQIRLLDLWSEGSLSSWRCPFETNGYKQMDMDAALLIVY